MVVDQCDPHLEAVDPLEENALHNIFSGKSCSYGVRDTKIEEFKNYIEVDDGKKMWKAFSYLKSELANH